MEEDHFSYLEGGAVSSLQYRSTRPNRTEDLSRNIHPYENIRFNITSALMKDSFLVA
jgi:hypothetical protein